MSDRESTPKKTNAQPKRPGGKMSAPLSSRPTNPAQISPDWATLTFTQRAALAQSPQMTKPGSSGRPLPADLRGRLEAGFRQPLDKVTIHDDSAGAAYARSRGSHAVTIGEDIYVSGSVGDGAGAERVLAHETAHVLQQRGGTPARIQDPKRYHSLEREADRAAEAALRGSGAQVSQADVAPQGLFDFNEKLREFVDRVGGPEVAVAMYDCYNRRYIPPQYWALFAQHPEQYHQLALTVAERAGDWVVGKIMELWVDDDDESDVIHMLERWADTPRLDGGNYLDALLDEVKTHTYSYDYSVVSTLIPDSSSASCLDLLFSEMEGWRYRRLCELVDTRSQKYAGYRGLGGFNALTGFVTAVMPSGVRDAITAFQLKISGRTEPLHMDSAVVDEINQLALEMQLKLQMIGVAVPLTLLAPGVGQHFVQAIEITLILALLAFLMVIVVYIQIQPQLQKSIERILERLSESEIVDPIPWPVPPPPPPAVPDTDAPARPWTPWAPPPPVVKKDPAPESKPGPPVFPTPPQPEEPRQRRKPRKPFRWDKKTSGKLAINSGGVKGALDFAWQSDGARSVAATEVELEGRKYEVDHDQGMGWQGHHVWPKNMGGAEDQPLMTVRHALHISVLHPALYAYLKTRGHNVSPNTTRNDAFIERLRTDAAFCEEVRNDLIAFYKIMNELTSPKMPAEAYERGIDDSFEKLT